MPGPFSPLRSRGRQAGLPPSGAREGTQVAWPRSDGGSSLSYRSKPERRRTPCQRPPLHSRPRTGCRPAPSTRWVSPFSLHESPTLQARPRQLSCSQGQRASPCCSAWHLSRAGGPGRSPQRQGTRRTSSVPASAAPGWASGVRPPFLARPAGPRRGLLVPVSISLILLLGPDYTPPWNPPFGLSRHSLSGTPCCTGPSQLSRPSAPVGHCVVLRLPLAFLLTPVGIAS